MLDNCQLSGAIPTTLSQLANLAYVGTPLAVHACDAVLVDVVGHACTTLHRLMTLSFNRLDGTLPVGLAQLTNLK